MELNIFRTILFGIGVCYIILALLPEKAKECKECEESKKNFMPQEAYRSVPVEVPDNDNNED